MPRFDEKRYTQVNARVINSWIEGGWQWGMPVSHAVCEQARAGTWGVRLTPTKNMPRTWLPDPLRGTRVLGLAAGGGQQMPVLACAGAVCTVLDFSDRQIETERLVAKREGYPITTVQADMTEPLPFDDESFDVIVHPVSNCYVEDVFAVWLECFRVLKPGGRLLSGLDNGFGYIFDDDYENVVRGLPFNPLRTRTRSRIRFAASCARALGSSTATRTQAPQAAWPSSTSPRSGPPIPRSLATEQG